MADGQTFKELKHTIEQEHPAAPRARDMRVIWKGRVLSDSGLVSSLYTGDPELPAPSVVHSVVHFVVSVPASIPGATKDDMVQKNGTPYLVERKAQIEQRIGSRLGPFGYGSQPASGSLDISEFNSRMINQHREARQQRQADPGQGINAGRDNNNGNRNRNNWQQQHPLAHAFRNITFDGVWSVIWLLLRGLLFLVVFAHDASWERVLMLLALVYFFMLLRTDWVQRRLQLLRQYQRNDIGNADNTNDGEGRGRDGADIGLQPENGQPQREFTALEKARALVIALFTSLIPAEPFQAPIPVGED
ncbi:hypothetical protein LPJ53_005379 [Coemansia erecta]|uniref:Ubiquitin-like domain-containing protein n=1 Tax=Coemansia erecta TaxID=147472 RepID=A0A9W8CPX5_9FUNG|nr:hypothetical protein LPJ53_005379 [Coemansia erecta]